MLSVNPHSGLCTGNRQSSIPRFVQHAYHPRRDSCSNTEVKLVGRRIVLVKLRAVCLDNIAVWLIGCQGYKVVLAGVYLPPPRSRPFRPAIIMSCEAGNGLFKSSPGGIVSTR